ncbi:MAG TPA: NADP-dependent oxidoreductase [Solirubrobacteraceae bacterium]|nr:NADP-dependent oxidoreductase [Solirubrobacteraceae bacterium]
MSEMTEAPQMEETTDAATMADATNGAMSAVSQEELGGPDVLRVVTIATPEPGVSQILIRVHAAGVNPIDGVNRQTGAFVGSPPFVLGWDVSGTVEAVGLGVTLFKPGDEVFGMLPFPEGHGAYAEYVVGPTRAFVPKPDRIDHVQAAAIPMVGLTAWQSLVDTADVGVGSRVAITGAAGGIGHLAVQIAKARGAHVTALAAAKDIEFVRSLGADEAIDYESAEFATAVGEQDIVLDVVGGDYPAQALAALKPGGILVSTQPPSLPPVAATAAERGIRLAGIIAEADQVGMYELAALAAAGKLVPTIAATFPIAQAGAASALADVASTAGRFPLAQGGATESGKHGPGKIVLTMM